MESSLNNIKQPKPSVENNKKLLNRPHLGVVDVPKFSKTPIGDTLEIKRKENPFTIYKLVNPSNKKAIQETITSFSIIGLGILSFLFSKTKKIKK